MKISDTESENQFQQTKSNNSSQCDSKLFQNRPNPFSEKTEIRCKLPENTKNAAIYIYDMQGIQKKSIKISDRGDVSVIIKGGEFLPGMYLYSLIADEQEIATKKMILTDL